MAGNRLWDEREGAQRRAGAAADLERRNDKQELVLALLGDLLEKVVLDDVDAVVGNHEHVHREHLEEGCVRRKGDRRARFERQRIVAYYARALPYEPLRSRHVQPGRRVLILVLIW